MKTCFTLSLFSMIFLTNFSHANEQVRRPLARSNTVVRHVMPRQDQNRQEALNSRAYRCPPVHVMPGQDRGRYVQEIPLSLMNPSSCYYPPVRIVPVPYPQRRVIVIEDPYNVPCYEPEFNFEIFFRGSRRC